MFCPDCESLKDVGLRCSCGVLLCPGCYERHVCPLATRLLWPSQEFGVRETISALLAGEKAICTTSPTGGGKTRMMAEIIQSLTEKQNWRVTLFTNRKVLTRQGTRT